MTHPRIGWIGLGHMGAPMAANLAKAGVPLTVYNRTPRDLPGIKVPVAASAAEAARGADIVVTMVSDDAAEEAVLFGPGGVAEALAPGQVVVNMGTVSPKLAVSVAERLAKRGVAALDAPVSGSVKPATDATLVILVGGAAEALETARPMFELLGKRTVHFGGPGQGARAKLAINLMLGVVMQGLAEAVTFGEASGLDTAALLDAIGESALASPLVAIKLAAIREGNFAAAFPLKHMAKDLRLASDAAAGAPIPAAEVVRGSYELAVNDGLGDKDVIAILESLRNA
ncbi:6-phosphogluconate dehydrogenase [uncultured Alphaproteobacteria bacterium]|uniref:6-phosphogluconate dehydrogenase n=1 Tax=uncultured Alphaproteobacteria bacterium TaxID=91750 RepID=A0A212KL80_9PROT|nr:6-phosphogluconate dehydrogenase [uncultured Alphaproteobacteria bacterium]